MTTPDPLIVPLGPLIGQEAGTKRAYGASSDAHAWLDTLDVRSPLTWSITLTRVEEGVLASNVALAITIAAPCDRCLTPFERACTVQGATVLFPLAPSVATESEDLETRGIDLAHQTLDLRPFLRDLLLLAAEAQRLCRPDCPGLCATCGALRSTCTCSDPPQHGTTTPLEGLSQLWNEHDS